MPRYTLLCQCFCSRIYFWECKPLVDWLKAFVAHDHAAYSPTVNPDTMLLAVHNTQMTFHQSYHAGVWVPHTTYFNSLKAKNNLTINLHLYLSDKLLTVPLHSSSYKVLYSNCTLRQRSVSHPHLFALITASDQVTKVYHFSRISEKMRQADT